MPALLTGNLAAAGVSEVAIVAGGEQTVITLVGDTWVAAGATFNAQRQAIIDGFTSAQVETLGWNNEVRDKEDVGAVARTSPTVVTITWTAAPLYDITISEAVIVTIPAAALVTSAVALIATPLLTVLETRPGTARVTGRRPRIQKISLASASHHIDGPERPFPVYQFSRRVFLERKGHNPFA